MNDLKSKNVKYMLKILKCQKSELVHIRWLNFFTALLFRFDLKTPVAEEPKFIVFCSMLMQLFSMFCFKCKVGKPDVQLVKNDNCKSKL